MNQVFLSSRARKIKKLSEHSKIIFFIRNVSRSLMIPKLFFCLSFLNCKIPFILKCGGMTEEELK